MNERPSMGPVLRHLGSCKVQITARAQDWETRKIGDGAQAGLAVGQSLIAFEAESFSELPSPRPESATDALYIKSTDIWDFVVTEAGPGGRSVRLHIFLHGTDILMPRTVSEVAAL